MLRNVNYRFLRIFSVDFCCCEKTTWSPLSSAFNIKSCKVKSRILGEPSGIFGYKELQDVDGLYLLADTTRRKVRLLINEIHHPNRSKKMVQLFDELSDVLFKAKDLAFYFQKVDKSSLAAKDTSESINYLITKLNTNRELYDKLRYVVENGDICPMSSMDRYIASRFLSDFEQFGIHLEIEKREVIADYSNYIFGLGSYIIDNISTHSFRKPHLSELIKNWFTEKRGQIFNGLFRNSRNKWVQSSHNVDDFTDFEVEDLLEILIREKQNFAELCNFPSYAHRALKGSIAETPEFVNEFLGLLNAKIKPKADEFYAKLLKLKQESNCHAELLLPYDVSRFEEQFIHREFNLRCSDYSPYFSLGACLDGLNYIFNSLFNVTLNIEETYKGELWHEDIKKLTVREGSDTLGFIYCDFFERPGKHGGFFQFSLQNGRLCDDGSYQKPVVVLMLSLPNPSWSQPPLLNIDMVTGLFHEMGHAMHSMLARTPYHCVSGNDCSRDFAEVPSMLMEFFAYDPRVLSKFARHYKTGEVMPVSIMKKLWRMKQIYSTCSVHSTRSKVFSAAIDQAFHSQQILNFSTTYLLSHLQNVFQIPYEMNPAGVCFETFIWHDAKCYSHLIAHAIASSIWSKYFNDDPFSSKQGKKYRDKVLVLTGLKPPRQIVEDFLEFKVTPQTLSDALYQNTEYRYV